MSDGDRDSKRAMAANATAGATKAESSDEYFERTVEQAVSAAVVQAADPSRRRFLAAMGSAALMALVAELLPLKEFAAFAADPWGNRRRPTSASGLFPSPVPHRSSWRSRWGSTSKHGLNAKVKRGSRLGDDRDWAVNKDVDAAHMLTPMPLAMTLGAGSVRRRSICLLSKTSMGKRSRCITNTRA